MQGFISYMMDKTLSFMVSEYFALVIGLLICVGIFDIVYGMCTRTSRPRR